MSALYIIRFLHNFVIYLQSIWFGNIVCAIVNAGIQSSRQRPQRLQRPLLPLCHIATNVRAKVYAEPLVLVLILLSTTFLVSL